MKRGSHARSRELPAEFWERLSQICPEEVRADVRQGMAQPRPLTVRMNVLRCPRVEIRAALRSAGILVRPLPWSEDALIVEADPAESLPGFYAQGRLYRQGLASMLPPLALAPQPDQRVLDLCAAPGSKTSQLAALMGNQGTILAVEAVRKRYYKLKAVCDLLGVTNVQFRCQDGRHLRPEEGDFDRILVDAPCSSEGRFRLDEPKTFAYWSLRKIREMARKQRGLLLSAARRLSPGGTLVYATCTFAPEENEGTVDWVLRKTAGQLRVVPVSLAGVPAYPCLGAWNDRDFDPQVRGCLRVAPREGMEGFFLARLTRAL